MCRSMCHFLFQHPEQSYPAQLSAWKQYVVYHTKLEAQVIYHLKDEFEKKAPISVDNEYSLYYLVSIITYYHIFEIVRFGGNV